MSDALELKVIVGASNSFVCELFTEVSLDIFRIVDGREIIFCKYTVFKVPSIYT